MGLPVVTGALLSCSFGLAPSSLTVIPTGPPVMMENKPAANIMDNKPFMNIAPFGVCNSLANPATASLTAAALGVLTPGPCVPATAAPWAPGSPTVLVGGKPALNDSSMCMCSFGGAITINFGGATTESIP
jgi:uncharacterized Zn-binding protein involved in type VI secretion